ncbi:immunity protein Imm33 domain-containing protein [Janthinobacterium sp. Mn2066]|uniref:immunity protein Imm33 domain-containing protein n=1 Tax=Janthinobacterium sp. Mn2066 TaxID=3395264 RepID=UPI003BBD1504
MSDKQRAICQRFETEYLPPEPEQKVGIALATLDKLPLYATRIPPENGTCGWYIYGGDYSADSDFYQSLHTAHLQEVCPSILPYLALPPGWCVILAPDYEDVWFDEQFLNGPREG